MLDKQIRFKVMIRTYLNGPWSSIVELPVTLVSWDEKSKKTFWLAKLEYAKTFDAKPLLFSRVAAEHVASQIGRFKFAGPSPNGSATAKIIPVTVEVKL